MLNQAKHNLNLDIIMQVKKICEYYQKHAKALHKFRFKLQNNINFNYTIYINIVQLKERDVLYIIDEAIGFGIA